MINYEQLEIDISDLLCPKLVDTDENITELNTIYLAKPLPDNEAEYQKNFTKPAVYVICTNSDYDSPESTDIIIQNETVNFEILLRSKTRKGPSGIFAIISDIKTKLLGYKFRGFTKIKLIKNGYIDSGTQNDWNYMISFSTSIKAIENLPEPVVSTFKKIDTNG